MLLSPAYKTLDLTPSPWEFVAPLPGMMQFGSAWLFALA